MRISHLVRSVGVFSVFVDLPSAEASIVDTSGTVVSGDFNNDGNIEVVVSSPETDCGKGAVYVVASSGSLVAWTRDSSGVLGTAACGDLFGASLAAGDFDGDGYDDLVIAAPDADDTGNPSSGSVHLIYGSASGLSSTGDQLWTLDSPGVGGVAKMNDHWGDALAVGDFNCDGYDDLAVGAPRKQEIQAMVSILSGTSGGITSVGDQLLSREGGFGAALAAGNFDAVQDNSIDCDDLIVAAPLQAVSYANAGVIHRYAGSAAGIASQPSQTIAQDVPGVADAPQEDDFFGWRVAAVQADDDIYRDLLVTVPGDGCSSGIGIGRHLFHGSASGITVTGNEVLCDTFGCSVFEDRILACHSGSAPVYGNALDDVISTGMSTGIIWGGVGDDSLYGDFGDDILFGGNGDDIIMGGPGRDLLIAGDGDDIIVIDHGCLVWPGEVVDGGPGSDTIRSHLSSAALQALGLTIVSVENFETIDENPSGSNICVLPPNDDGPYLRPPVSASWSGLTTPEAELTTTAGLLTLELANTSADDIVVDVEFRLNVRGEELLLEEASQTIMAESTGSVILDLNDFIPGGINPATVDPSLLVLPVSASISTRVSLRLGSDHIGDSFAPTIFGHLEIDGSEATAILYREGALHNTYHHGDLGRWRANAAAYTGSARLMGRIEVHGSYGIPGY